MYIDHIEIENFRTFRNSKITFCHVDQDFVALGMPEPQLPNMNLLLANNGYGKLNTSGQSLVSVRGRCPNLSRIKILW